MELPEFQGHCRDYVRIYRISSVSSQDVTNLGQGFLDARERGLTQDWTPGLAYVMASFYFSGRASRETARSH